MIGSLQASSQSQGPEKEIEKGRRRLSCTLSRVEEMETKHKSQAEGTEEVKAMKFTYLPQSLTAPSACNDVNRQKAKCYIITIPDKEKQFYVCLD